MKENSSQLIPVVLCFLLSAAGCIPPVLTGHLIDSPVEGVCYVTETQEGCTDENGAYNYIAGESITFSIGDITFPTVGAAEYLTPLIIFAQSCLDDEIEPSLNCPQVINMTRFLQSLDEDLDPSNGIKIPFQAVITVITNIELWDLMDEEDFARPVDEFANDQRVVDLLDGVGLLLGDAETRVIVETEEAIEHIAGEIDVSARWYLDSDGDGYGDTTQVLVQISQPSGYVIDNFDCDDSVATIYPGAPELHNGVDDNCDGIGDWQGTQQFGSDQNDIVRGMTGTEDGGVVLVGTTYDVTNARNEGAVWKRDVTGVTSWSMLADQYSGELIDVTTDNAGNVYAAGYIVNTVDNTNWDATVIKLNVAGQLEWQIYLSGIFSERGFGITFGSDSQLYVVGATSSPTLQGQSTNGEKIFVASISTSGVLGWITFVNDAGARDFGCISQTLEGDIVVAYQSNTGYPTLGDISVAKLSNNGDLLSGWPVAIQLGDSNEYVLGKCLALDIQGDIYIGGFTESSSLYGDTNNGIFDAFIMKLQGSDGTLLWGNLLGGNSNVAMGFGVALDSVGNVLLSGYIEGALPGQTSAGSADLFLAKWDNEGDTLWAKQYGSAGYEEAVGIAFDLQGQVLVGGSTDGYLEGNTNLGGRDAFLVKLDSATGLVVPPAP